jgi:hypothetical protein
MPRLSLYKSEKGPDFKFIDRTVNEQFQVGGTDVFIHKYLGSVTPEDGTSSPTAPNNSNNPVSELGIQDVLFMENRDRSYSPDVYVIRGIYQMQDLDFNLSQFGLFLQNDTVMMHFHLRSTVELLQRKIMPGDVIELPHLKDEYALDNNLIALKRFYVVQDVSRPAAGFSQTWYPHLLRAKCVPLIDSQEFSQIFNADAGNQDGSTLRDLMSTYNQSIDINNQIVEQAMLDAPVSGYNTKSFYIIPTVESGLVDVADASDMMDDASIEQAVLDSSVVLHTPSKNLYVGYLTGDGVPPNGAPFDSGITFTVNPAVGAFYLRTDYMPNALYRFDGVVWNLYEKNVKMTMNQFGQQDVASGIFAGKQVRQTQKAGFINNINTATINGKVVEERQALSQALKPRADN